ncbi:hypothetical protein ACFPZE_17170 [Pseudoxanthomonas mexicana]|uniref:hypothetical protein n=1 Tax=Pseudoxanthomonas mexicana TaxID=128785 RepID=UPI00360AD8AF
MPAQCRNGGRCSRRIRRAGRCACAPGWWTEGRNRRRHRVPRCSLAGPAPCRYPSAQAGAAVCCRG